MIDSDGWNRDPNTMTDSDGWAHYQDSAGYYYWHNHQTGESAWAETPEIDGCDTDVTEGCESAAVFPDQEPASVGDNGGGGAYHGGNSDGGGHSGGGDSDFDDDDDEFGDLDAGSVGDGGGLSIRRHATRALVATASFTGGNSARRGSIPSHSLSL